MKAKKRNFVANLLHIVYREWKYVRMQIQDVALSERGDHHVLMSKIDGKWIECQSGRDRLGIGTALILIGRDLLFKYRYPELNE